MGEKGLIEDGVARGTHNDRSSQATAKILSGLGFMITI